MLTFPMATAAEVRARLLLAGGRQRMLGFCSRLSLVPYSRHERGLRLKRALCRLKVTATLDAVSTSCWSGPR